jgi:uncharacterized membrane protein
MSKLKIVIAVLVVILSAINIYLYWDTPAVYGWIVAVAGWVDHCFQKKTENA